MQAFQACRQFVGEHAAEAGADQGERTVEQWQERVVDGTEHGLYIGDERLVLAFLAPRILDRQQLHVRRQARVPTAESAGVARGRQRDQAQARLRASLRCNHRARARSVAAATAARRRHGSGAHHFAGIRIALQQPQARLPAGQPAQFGDRLHAQQRMPAGAGEALVGRQRPAEHPDNTLSTRRSSTLSSAWTAAGGAAPVLEQRQQRLAVGVGQCLGALGGETSGGVLEAHLEAFAGHLEVHRQRTSTSTTTWSRRPPCLLPPPARRVVLEIES